MRLSVRADLPAEPSSDVRVKLGDYVCWSRMQAEAGQALSEIIKRKEAERKAGDGVFLWGVGNAPAVLTGVLARSDIPVRVIFSIMKSRPKLVDRSPTRTLLWRSYLDKDGVERPLPPFAVVTSRGESAAGQKRTHYALMCKSDVPLELRQGEHFPVSAFRNASGNEAPVGASQVTALLRRTAEATQQSDYQINLSAWLTGSYWVRLTDPVELDARKLDLLGGAVDNRSEPWSAHVAKLRDGLPATATTSVGHLL